MLLLSLLKRHDVIFQIKFFNDTWKQNQGIRKADTHRVGQCHISSYRHDPRAVANEGQAEIYLWSTHQKSVVKDLSMDFKFSG